MNTKLLLPSYFRIIGLVLLVPGLVLGGMIVIFSYTLPFLQYGPRRLFSLEGGNLTDEIATTLIITGAFFIGFSRLRRETRITQKLRVNALYWAMVVNGIIVVVTTGYAALLLLLIKFSPKWADVPVYYMFYSAFFTLFLFLARYYYLLFAFRRNRLPKRFYLLPDFPWNTLAKTLVVLFLIFLGLSFIPSSHIDRSGDAFTDIYLAVVVPCSLLCAWTREEKETSNDLRLNSVPLAFFINYVLFLAATWFIYQYTYLYVIEISFSSLQLIFTLVFYARRKMRLKIEQPLALKTT